MINDATIHFTSIIYGFLLLCFRRTIIFAPILVQFLFLTFALFIAVIRRTSLRGFFAAVSFPAAKGTAKIIPAGISRMGKKKNVAMLATGQAGFEMGLFFKN